MIRKFVLTIALLALLFTGCAPQDGLPVSTPEEKDAELANPASVFCEEKGNQVEIRTAADGGQYGVCIFPDRSECEEWAYYRGECAPGTPPAGGAASPEGMPTVDPAVQDKVVEIVRSKLAAQLNVDAAAITVTSVEFVFWRDGCLDLGGPDEMCTAVITPGFKVVLAVDQVDYVFHTDETGGKIRMEK